MWWRGFGQEDYWWDRSIEDPNKNNPITVSEFSEPPPPPTPQELVFEVGLVLAGVLTLAVLAEFGLWAFGIPPV